MTKLLRTGVLLFLWWTGGNVACVMAARASAFALPVGHSAEVSDGLLAQRVIERKWGPSDDSTYVTVAVPGWRDENKALVLSALLPGTGQLYAGERSGYFFLAAEAVGWFEWWYLRHRGKDIRNQSLAFAGDPNDSLSRWAFSNYEQRTGRSTDDLRRIYAADRSLFYYLIARDESLRAGWEDYSLGYYAVMGDRFIEIREDSQAHYKRARYFQAALWTHHVVAALDAMRVARLHNLQFSRTLKLGIKSRWVGDGPELAAAIEARF